MKHIETEIVISSTPDKVWEVLTDFEKYPDWNPFIKSVKGNRQQGEQLTVRIQPPESKEMRFTPVILKYKKNNELRWKGQLGMKGIFDGEHYFKLIDLDNGQTSFLHGENFSGILVPFMGKSLQKTEKGFEQMNVALKQRCEQANVPREKIQIKKASQSPKKKIVKRPGSPK